jgi:hypothetical protein
MEDFDIYTKCYVAVPSAKSNYGIIVPVQKFKRPEKRSDSERYAHGGENNLDGLLGWNPP